MTTRQRPAATRATAASGQRPARAEPHRGRRSVLAWTVVLAVLVLGSSVAALVDPRVYERETANWALQAQGQDIGNLLAVVVLTAAAVRHAQGSWRAAQVWLGTVLYLVYAFVVYAMAVQFSELFLVYVAVLGVSAWAVLLSVGRLRAEAATGLHRASARWPAVVLVVIGAMFALLWLSELVPATVSGEVPANVVEAGVPVNPVHVIDLSVVLPAFVLTGVAALRGAEAGRFWLGPWLVFSVLMGSSIVAAMVLMMVAGEAGALAPAVGVSVVVLASLAAAVTHLGRRLPTG